MPDSATFSLQELGKSTKAPCTSIFSFLQNRNEHTICLKGWLEDYMSHTCKAPEHHRAQREYSLNTSSHPFFFSLKVRGYPEPQVTWHRSGQPITGGGRFLLDGGIRGTFSLVICAVREEDSGKYTCEASNGSGARQVTVELTIEGESQEVRSQVGDARPAVPASTFSWERNPQKKAHPS